MVAWSNIATPETEQTKYDAPIELLPVLLRLEELTALWRVVVLEVRLDRLVLLVELRQIRHEVLDDVHCGLSEPNARGLHAKLLTVGERVNLGVLAGVAVNSAEACKGILSVDVHSARTANAFTA